LLGSRKVDTLGAPSLLSLAEDFARPGSLRVASERINQEKPEIFCLHGVSAGDAFAIATRFDCDWAYRGGQALFWKATLRAREVHDRYLPSPLLRPFERRGLLEVDGERRGRPMTLIATQLSDDRAHIREIRLVRKIARSRTGSAILFVAGFDAAMHHYGFGDLGLHSLTPGIYVREA
jgi:hypothetical protein